MDDDIKEFIDEQGLPITNYVIQSSSYGKTVYCIEQDGSENDILIEDISFHNKLIEYLIQHGATIEVLPEP